MPPANQNSKAALVTWTVICTVFGVVSIVIAVLMYTQKSTAEQRADQLRDKYTAILPEPELTTTAFTNVKTEVAESPNPQTAAFSYLNQTRENLASMISSGSGYTGAQTAAQAALRTASETTETTPQSLTEAVSNMATRIRSLERQVADANNETAAVRAAMEQAQTDANTEMASFQQRAEEAEEARRHALANEAETQQQYETALTEFDSKVNDLVTALKEEYNDLDGRFRQATSELAQATRENKEAFRRLNPNAGGDQLLTQPDGEIIRTGDAGRMTINRGRNDGINRGLTFQVYDQLRGIPAVDINNNELPQGKASIEVISVGPTSSEARIINQVAGTGIKRGDLIANLAYDKNSPKRFRVYGRFDLENDGNASEEDRQRFMSIVRELGGEIVDDVTVDTDIVVLGVEPVVPDFTDVELEDPLNAQLRFQAQQAKREYDEVLAKANRLNKSILNQNQALFYLGYYDQATR